MCYGLTAWVLATNLILMIKFNRNEVLSHLAHTVPNRFTLDRSLVLPLVTYVVFPLLSIFLVHFPGLGRLFFGWADTLRRVLQG